jgi:glucose/arabinose dehydrogenase
MLVSDKIQGVRKLMKPIRAGSLLFTCLVAVLVALPGPAHSQVEYTNDPPQEPLPADVVVETVISDITNVVPALTFAPDGRMFYSLKGGPYIDEEYTAEVRIYEDGQVRKTPFLTTQVSGGAELGLLGIAFDPNYLTNRYVYIYRIAPPSETGTGQSASQVIRYVEDRATQTAIIESATVILDVPVVPGSDRHVGGNLRFGPDGKLYVSIGDNFRIPSNSQDLSTEQGGILRLNPDGTAPADNPFTDDPEANDSIWMYGLRNPYDYAFDPVSGQMFIAENGAHCDDEINRGQPGGNFGWPDSFDMEHIECREPPADTVAPIYRHPRAIGISGIDFYTGPIEAWTNDLFWCGSITGLLYHGQLNAERTDFTSVGVIEGSPLCHIDVASGPDGALYIVGVVNGMNTISRIRPADLLVAAPDQVLGTQPAGQSRSYAVELNNIGGAPMTWTASITDPEGIVTLREKSGDTNTPLHLDVVAPDAPGVYEAMLLVQAEGLNDVAIPVQIEATRSETVLFDGWPWVVVGIGGAFAVIGILLWRRRVAQR